MKFSALFFAVFTVFIFESNGVAAFANDDESGIIIGGSTSQFRAKESCPQGSHLPTIRELATLAQAHGAKGILELKQVDPSKIPDGYYLVSSVNTYRDRSDNSWKTETDDFYYSHQGYRPEGILGEISFWWSSSVSYPCACGYGIKGNSFRSVKDYLGGLVTTETSELHYGFLCLPDHKRANF